jgi:predicted 3-demethylubiquinone-9 3-methyltransferase (glyoxalase superfamily)
MTLKPSQKIVPFLWFDNQAEQAANFYTSVFPESKIISVNRQPALGVSEQGAIMSVNFELQNQLFYGFNGGPHFQFTPAISLFVHCDNQEEVDYYWEKLVEGGRPERCGWLTDAYGLSWQIIPRQLGQALQQSDQRALQAMLKMTKIIIQDLENS